MRFHSPWKILTAGMGCGLVAAACSAPDPGAYTLSDKTPRVADITTSSGGSSGASGGSSGASGGSSSGGSSGSSGSSGASGDAGRDAGGSSGVILPDAFKGAPAYVATDGQQATAGGHNNPPNNLPPQHECLNCHTPGGAAAAKEFIAGGYVGKAGGGGPENKAEVRIIDGNGAQVVRAYTEANGFWYVLGSNLTGTHKVGVRNATTALGMVGTITSGGCAAGGCHAPGAQNDVHL